MESRQENKKRFLEQRNHSIALKLMIPNSRYCGIILNNDDFCPISFRAWLDGNLPVLEELFNRWKIEHRATNQFKKKIAEDWLIKATIEREACRSVTSYRYSEGYEELIKAKIKGATRRILKASHNTLSAISELCVASYLDSEGYDVSDLAAWNNNSPDVLIIKSGTAYHTEVKYLPWAPEDFDLEFEVRMTGGIAMGHVPDEPSCVNYYYYRLAEALIQLERSNCRKWAFLVFDNSVDKAGVDLFCSSIGTSIQWYRNTLGVHEGIIAPGAKCVMSKAPHEWVSVADRLTISIWEPDFTLKILKQHGKTIEGHDEDKSL